MSQNLAIDTDSLLEELEESIPQGRPLPTRAEPDAFDELDDLLQESLDEVSAKKQYAEDLKARKRNFTGMSAEEAAFCNSRMQAFEQARIWRPVKNLAVFTQFECTNCHDTKRVFTRWMLQEKSRTNATARRWETVAEAKANLPTEAAMETRKTSICTSCAPMLGIDTHGARTLSEVLQ
jgi:hypothetical protein